MQTLDFPTLDLVVINSSTRVPWRASRERRVLAIAALAALACGAVAWLERPAAVSDTSARPKLAARILVAPDGAPSEDDARMAAFQEAVALSSVKSVFATAGDGGAQPVAVAVRPAHRRTRAVPVLAKRDAGAATPVPPPRPVTPTAIETPMVIEAVLPPAPAPDPSYIDASLYAMGDAARGIALAPERARNIAVAAVERMSGALSQARANLGFRSEDDR
jgi:hypothetical protein